MEKSRHYSWLIAVLSTLTAVGLHSYLSFKFYALRFGALGHSSVCNFNELWNCDAVSASAYSQLFGIPMAVWGLVTNFILVLMLIVTRLGWVESEQRGQRYTSWLAVIIFLASVVMGIISAALLKNLCLFCVLSYVLSIFSFVGVLIWARPHLLQNLMADVKALFSAHRGFLVGILVIPILAFFLNSIFLDNFQGDKMALISVEKIAQWGQAPLQNFKLDQGLVEYKGSGSPKMEIIEFADFRCPHCKEAYFAMDAFVASHTDVKLIFKFYPLDGTCNPEPAMTGKGDGISCEAAFAVHCSEKLFKKGWQAHHAFFDNQEKLQSYGSKDEVTDFICKETQSDCGLLKSCTSSIETRNEVQAMAAEGIAAGVRGTPSIYVNNRQLGYGQFLPVLEKAYENLHSN